jgi:hypothetical protein
VNLRYGEQPRQSGMNAVLRSRLPRAGGPKVGRDKSNPCPEKPQCLSGSHHSELWPVLCAAFQ